MRRNNDPELPYGWGPRKILLTAIAGVMLTVAASCGAWWLLDRPSSEIPSWIEAGATVVGVGAAITAGFYAARAFLLEFQRERRWEEQQQSAQASLIAAWPGEHYTEPMGNVYRIYGAEAHVRNASPLPASRIKIAFHVSYFDAQGEFEGIDVLGTTELAYLPPDEKPRRVVYFSHHHTDGKTLPIRSEGGRTELSIETFFRDSSGAGWFRNLDGRLAPRAEYVLAPH